MRANKNRDVRLVHFCQNEQKSTKLAFLIKLALTLEYAL